MPDTSILYGGLGSYNLWTKGCITLPAVHSRVKVNHGLRISHGAFTHTFTYLSDALFTGAKLLITDVYSSFYTSSTYLITITTTFIYITSNRSYL